MIDSENLLNLRDFINGLKLLTNLDFNDLTRAGVLTDDEDGDAEWEDFRDNPWKWMIAANDSKSEKLWSLMKQRGLHQ